MLKIENKKYLVTGGSGFLGKSLCSRIIDAGGQVRAMARDEGKLIELKQALPDVEIYPGDIADPFEVKQAMVGVNGVFHLAASKHVGLAEKFVRENTKTNILGSLNILEESLKNQMDFVLGVSTDKAAQVNGVYGATKLMMERMFHQFEEINSSTEYRIVRYGNVLYSTGSVLCKWKDLIQSGGEVVVTSLDATRFFWTVSDAVDLIFDCMDKAVDSAPYCPEMKSMSINNLLHAMILKYGNGADIKIKTIGLQAGENLHEKVLENGPFSNECQQFTVEEIIPLI